MKILTEAETAIAFAKAWNTLDSTDFLKLLAPDVCYASQWVFEELEGKDSISDYLIGKMETVKKSSVSPQDFKVYAELGKTAVVSGRDCVLMAQGQKEQITSLVVFEVENGLLKRFDMCMPELYGFIRTNIYPV